MPELNSFGTVPGITTDFDGMYPLRYFGLSPLTSIIFVDEVKTTFAPKTASFSILTPSTIIHLDPMNASSSIITGAA